MRRTAIRACLCVSLALSASPAFAQAAAPAAPAGTTPLPKMLMIVREDVRPGKGAAHTANEIAWAAAFAKNQAPVGWLGMTTIAGPTEAWFLSPYDSWAALQKEQDAMAASDALSAEEDTFQAIDGELLTRTSRLMVAFRPAISYQPEVNMPQMRYLAIDVVRVKPGRVREFLDVWRSLVDAHKTAKMDEHWAVYQVVAGQPDGTFLFIYAMKSLEEIDKAGPMHSADAFRDAVGESGRARNNEALALAVESSQRLVFALSPRLSLLDKTWTDADAYWTPKPLAAAPVASTKKK